MKVRCVLLAHRYGPQVYECPNNSTAAGRFHFHGDDPSAPFRVLVGGRPCEHRHQTMQAAVLCTGRLHNNPRV